MPDDTHVPMEEAEERIAHARRTGARSLKLSGMHLLELPPSLWELSDLTELDLDGNRLTELSEKIVSLTKLTYLSVNGNQLERLPDSIDRLVRLTTLCASHNKLTQLPDSFVNLSALSVLHLFRNRRLARLPDEFGDLGALEELDLSETRLEELPESFGHLRHLRRLQLHTTHLTALPDQFGKLANLRTAHLYHCKMTALPAAFGQLARLESLFLYGNQLTRLPKSFCRLGTLAQLDLNDNSIEELPSDFGRLSNLRSLRLQRNQLTALPPSLPALRCLEQLHLHDNPDLNIPDEVLGPRSALASRETVAALLTHVFGAPKKVTVVGSTPAAEVPIPKRVFISYSHKDETHKAVLVGYLARMIEEGLIHCRDDRYIRPSDDWDGEIHRYLNDADVILLLLSRNFKASTYITRNEVPAALKRQAEGANVVPIILDETDFGDQPFMTRQALPTDAKPILSKDHWRDPNDAWRHVASELRAWVTG